MVPGAKRVYPARTISVPEMEMDALGVFESRNIGI
jgi:hypothetical protein